MHYAPIAYHRDERGYYYEEGFSIDNLQLNDEELESIRFAARTLVQFRNVPMFSQFGQAIGKIDDRLRMAPDLDTAQLDSIVQFESAPATRGSEHLQPLLQAIKGDVVSLSYRKFKSEGAEALLVHPYLLKEYRNRWYVIAWNPDRSDYRTYGLDRMESVEEQDDGFALRRDFDADHFFKHSFGISKSTEAPQDVRVRCNQLEYEYLAKSQPVHPSQQLIRIDEDVYELQLHVLVTFELVHFLLGFGAAIEVIAPESLHQRMEAVHRAALDRYL